MKILLVSNNLVIENIDYNYLCPIEDKRVNRPLSIAGEKKAKELVKKINVNSIYASNYASAIGSAKYISEAKNIPIIIDKEFRDSEIGDMGKNNIQMLRFMQERNYDFKYPNGESLKETKYRMLKAINKIIDNNEDCVVFTHNRAILGLLLEYCDTGYNLDERLILSYNDKVILDDAYHDMDLIEMDFENNKVINIKRLS